MKKQDISENQAKLIFLGIGSNLGNRISNIEKAKFKLFQNRVKILQSSSYYKTPSWPDPKYPAYLNIILKVTSKLKPEDLLKMCKEIESSMGRKKAPKNSPRVCDIDIIDYKNLIKSGQIFLPHPQMHQRNFVLFPLFEISKDWMHPVFNTNIKKLILSLPNKDITSIKQL